MGFIKMAGSVVAKTLADGMSLTRGRVPKVVRVETTNHCQADCIFCPRSTIGRSKGFMTQELFEKIVNECAQGGVRVLHLHNFGEPLIDKQLPERVAFAKRAGIKKVKIFSNGGLLKGDAANRLLRSGLDELKVSVDGADKAEFEQLRIGLSHTEVVENTLAFRKARDAAGLKNSLRIIATTCQSSNRAATNEMLAQVVDRVEHTKLHNWAGSYGVLNRVKLRKPCDRLWRTFTILINGDVAICCRDHAGKEVIGNVSQDSIQQVWNNHRYEELRRLHRESRQEEIPICSNCTSCYFGARHEAA